MSREFPSPPARPLIGHVGAIESEVPLNSFYNFSKQCGEIFQLQMLGESLSHESKTTGAYWLGLGRKLIVLGSQELLHDVSDDKRYRKTVGGGLYEVRNAVKDGLFTVRIIR